MNNDLADSKWRAERKGARVRSFRVNAKIGLKFKCPNSVGMTISYESNNSLSHQIIEIEYKCPTITNACIDIGTFEYADYCHYCEAHIGWFCAKTELHKVFQSAFYDMSNSDGRCLGCCKTIEIDLSLSEMEKTEI